MATEKPNVLDPPEQHMDAPYHPSYAGEELWTVLPAGRQGN